MASTSLPFTLTAGAVENVNQLNSNLNALLAAVNSVDNSQLDATTVMDKVGITGGGVTRRGVTAVSTTQSTSSASYTTLTTPDQVSNVVLPASGLIAVAYQATWQESVVGAARAAIFVGATQLKFAPTTGGAPVVSEASTGGTSGTDGPLASSLYGLQSSVNAGVAYSGNVTTGQAVGQSTSAPTGGPCYIFAAAGTYTISVQFKASSGSVTAKNRTLWVWTLGF